MFQNYMKQIVQNHISLTICRYFKILVQEMSVQVDQGFLNAIIMLFASGEVNEEAMKEAFIADCQMIDLNLALEASSKSENEQKHFYDNLHFSPLKVSAICGTFHSQQPFPQSNA